MTAALHVVGGTEVERRAFLETLHPTGYRDVRALQNGELKAARVFPAGEFDRLEQAITKGRDHYDLYMGVATRAHENGRGLRDCLALHVLFADLDFKLSSEAEARAALAAFPLPPSIVVASGGGLHCYWLLATPLNLPSEAPRAKQLLRALARATGGDLKSASPAHPLRLPGTLNHKYTPPRAVAVEKFDTTRTYAVAELEALIGPLEPLEVEKQEPDVKHNLPVAKRRQQAAAWLTHRDPAIQGQGGDHHTYVTCCAVVWGFDLAEDDAFAVLQDWNRRCQPAWVEADLRKKVQNADRYGHPPRGSKLQLPATVPNLTTYSLAKLLAFPFPTRRALLTRGGFPVLREGDFGEIFAIRGVGKTWFATTLALVAASGVEALGFGTPEPSRVLYVDGEMAAEEIKQRFAALCIHLSKHPDPLLRQGLHEQLMDARLDIIAADWQENYIPRLDTVAGQDALEPHIEQADLIFLDNRSCLFDPEGEKDASAWQPAQDWLLSLRRRGKNLMLVHHSNRQGGARGHSKAEDPMNLLIKLTRPEDYDPSEGARFVVEFDKARAIYGAAAASFVAALTPNGWEVGPVESKDDPTEAKLREYLQAGNRPKSASDAVKQSGVNRNQGFRAWKSLVENGDVVEGPDGFQLVTAKEGTVAPL